MIDESLELPPAERAAAEAAELHAALIRRQYEAAPHMESNVEQQVVHIPRSTDTINRAGMELDTAGAQSQQHTYRTGHSPDSDTDRRCDVEGCGQLFASSSNLRRHQAEVHGSGGGTRRKCPICGREKYNLNKLRQHLDRCTGPTSISSTSSTTTPATLASDDNGLDASNAAEAVEHEPGRIQTVAAVRGPDITGAVITNEQLDTLSADFMQYLNSQPISFLEHRLIRTRCPPGSAGWKQVQSTLRYILSVVLTTILQAPDDEMLTLRFICSKSAVEKLFETLEQRGVKAERIYQVSLLCMKYCLFVARQANRARTTFTVDQIESWPYLRSVNDTAGRQRKIEETARLLRLSTTTNDILTSAEAATLADETVSRLQEFIGLHSSDEEHGITVKDARSFQYYLLTCMMVHLPWRSQTYAHLHIGTTLLQLPHGGFQVQYNGLEHAKHHQPLVSEVPELIGNLLQWYLDNVRPVLVAAATRKQTEDQQYLFPNPRDLGPVKHGFAHITRAVTLQLLGKALNPHSFRTSIVTMVHQARVDQRRMDELALSMQHTSASQARYYVRQRHVQASANTNQLLANLLQPVDGPQATRSTQPVQRIIPLEISRPVEVDDEDELPIAIRFGTTARTRPNTVSGSRAPSLRNDISPSVPTATPATAVNLSPIAVRHHLVNEPTHSVSSQRQTNIALVTAMLQPSYSARRATPRFDDTSLVVAAAGEATRQSPRPPSVNTPVQHSVQTILPLTRPSRKRAHPSSDIDFSDQQQASVSVVSDRNQKRYKTLRRPMLWTNDQLTALQVAHAVHGNKWSNVLRDPQFAEIFSGRNSNQLKSKWHHLSRTALPDAASPTTSSGSEVVELLDVVEIDELPNEVSPTDVNIQPLHGELPQLTSPTRRMQLSPTILESSIQQLPSTTTTSSRGRTEHSRALYDSDDEVL